MSNQEREAKIKAALILKGLKQKDAAVELGISTAAVSMFVKGKRKSRRFDAWLKRRLGVEL